MCTVTFLPLSAGGYLLATNRDERPSRGAARPPTLDHVGGRRVLAPRDRDAGGAWIAVDDDGRSLCILNGDRPLALAPAADAPSRGLLVLALMADPAPDAVLAELERRRSAGQLREKGFKLLVAEPGRARRGASCRRIEWDGAQLTVRDSSRPLVAVSSSFDADAVTQVRSAAFRPLSQVATPAPGEDGWQALAAAQASWHRGHRDGSALGDAHSVCMHRPDARTVSATYVAVHSRAVHMRYQAGYPCQAGPLTEVRLRRLAEASLG